MEDVSCCKVVLLGDTGVGKTCLVQAFKGQPFEEHEPTIGALYQTISKYYNNKKYDLQVYDTAGQEIYRAITLTYIRDAKIVLLCFDLTSDKSFDNMNSWYNYVQENINSNNSPVYFLIGNKSDLVNEITVSDEAAINYANSISSEYFCVSAKDGTNVESLLNEMAKCAASLDEKYQPNKKLIKTNTQEKPINCC